MKGLSRDIELAIDTIIQGLEYSIDVDSFDSTKLKSLMKSKSASFKYAKDMINKWSNSQNSPNNDKLRAYIERLVDAGDKALDTLREGLRKEINYQEEDEDKHYQIVEGKSVIYEAIVSIDSDLLELRLQLDADKFNLGNKEFKRGYPEKFANQEFFPLKNYYKDWYDIDNDSVVIDPKGSRGKIINLDGLNITLPVPPPDKEILFYDLPKEEQYWRRTELPKGLTIDNLDSFKSFIIEEFRRRREGLWFFNNGEPTWLPPSFYFTLNWVKMKDDGGYMDFRYSQLEMAYHKQACLIDTRCMGQIFVKSRRTGATFLEIGDNLHLSTSTSNANFGMTSKSNDDAKEMFQKLTYAYQNLPVFFQPVLKNFADSSRYLSFSKPMDRTKETKLKKDTKTDDYLNTMIDYKPTNEGSYDGYRMFRYSADEFSKWHPNSFEKHWGQVSPTLDLGGRIVGKAFLLSTIAAQAKGGEEAYNLYKASQVKDRNKITKRTPSGLYAYFLPAHKNMAEFTDKYGKCWQTVPKNESFVNIYGDVMNIGSIEYLEAQRKSKRKTSEIAYNEELRAYPMSIEDAFRDEATSCLFSLEKINEQLEYIGKLKYNPVQEGDFVWKDGIRDTEVIFVPKPNGHFKVAWIPPENMRNARTSRMGYGGYSYAPLNEHLGAFGCDSYDIEGTVEDVGRNINSRSARGSKGALHGLTKIQIGETPANFFFLEYIHREGTTEIFFENVLKACVFYGMPIFAENNKPRLLYHFRDRGYRNFAITRFDKPLNKLSATEKMIGGAPNSGTDMISMHSTAIESYVDQHIGYIPEEGDYHKMYFERTLRDWQKFDINKRTKFDAAISSGLAIMAVNKDKYTVSKKSNTGTIKINIKRKAS